MWTHLLLFALTGCAPTSHDVLFVVDISGSMAADHTTEKARIDAVRDTTQSMIAELVLNDYSTQVGVVTFVAGAELWAPLANINTDTAFTSVDEQLAALDWCDRSYSPWATAYGGAYHHEAPQMLGCDTMRTDEPEISPSDAGTAHDEALQLAISELLAVKEPGRSSEIVLFTDGPATCVPADLDCADERQTQAEAVVESTRFQDIVINVVYLEEPQPLPESEVSKICSLATPAYDGDCLAENPFFYTVPSGDEDALMNVAATIF